MNSTSRGEFFSLAALAAAGVMAVAFATPCGAAPLNLLLITVDDMNYDSLGVTGGTVPNITPNIDLLASQGMRFENAHVNIAVCQPCRESLMTGRYPHRNGGMGFEPIDNDVPTLQEQLDAAGYVNGILAKVGHLAPQSKFKWSTVVQAAALDSGRGPALYYAAAKSFFDAAIAGGTPFYLMANSQDPHRPFAGSDQEQNRWGMHWPVSRTISTAEVTIPAFLPNLPEILLEMSEYYTSTYRCDETVGEVLRALSDSGAEANTLVMFLSDHGMPLPYAKTNCWLNSTKTPWIVRWPGVTTAGTVDSEHFISGIDYMPTILEAAGLPAPDGMDGRSFVPLLQGMSQTGRDKVFTEFHRTAGGRKYPMRSVITKDYGYIYNAWSDGVTAFINESQNGRAWNAMTVAAGSDPAIAARVNFFSFRVREEFYDYAADPDALNNLIDDPAFAEELNGLRRALRQRMIQTGDPLLQTYLDEVMAGVPPTAARLWRLAE